MYVDQRSTLMYVLTCTLMILFASLVSIDRLRLRLRLRLPQSFAFLAYANPSPRI